MHADDGIVGQYHVTPECSASEGSPIASLSSFYIYSSNLSDTVIPNTPTPAGADPIPAENDTFVGEFAPEESSDTVIPSTPIPPVAEPMPAEDDIVNELASEESFGAVIIASSTPTSMVENPMPVDDDIVDELASVDLSDAVTSTLEVDPTQAEDEIVDELAPEDATIPSILASESEGNQGDSEPLGSVWKLDDQYPNAGPVHHSA